MSKTLYLKPTDPGLIVRDPDNRRALPVDGCDVPDTPYWRRRINDGDVSIAKRPAPIKKKD